jgi:hypothetical protein
MGAIIAPVNTGWTAERNHVSVVRALGAVLGCLMLFCGASVSNAWAGTITVTSLGDSGAGTLRQAIAVAAVNETISVPTGKITLTSGPLVISKNLTIAGAGSHLTSISGNDASRVLTITGTPTVTLEGLEITHGNNIEGAGIEASGEVTLRDVLVSGNHAGGAGVAGFGGGIEFGSGKYTLIECAVSENSAGGGNEGAGFGGGIEYDSSADSQSFVLSLIRSSVNANHAGGGGAESSGFGAGIDVDTGHDSGSISLTLDGSVLSGNIAGGGGHEASGFGGGLSLGSGGSKNTLALTLEQSAITGNRAGGGEAKSTGFGGGIEFSSGGSGVTQTFDASDSTISSNQAGGGGADGFGGGISFGSGSATLSYLTIAGNSAGGAGGASHGAGLEVGSLTSGGIGSSILAGNIGGNCATSISSAGHNIDDGETCGFKGVGDRSATDAKLGPLGEHGGGSPTQMPLAGSPAIGGGDSLVCPALDQRGVTRPQAAGCDIGAVEVAPPQVTAGSITSVGSESATITGAVTPNFSATSYRLEFGTSAAYGGSTGEASAGEGGEPKLLTAELMKLRPQTTYHFRVVATNAAGTVYGPDQAITTTKEVLQAPTLSSVSLTNTRFRVGRNSTAVIAKRAPAGTSFRFALTSPAAVKITITRSARGLRRGRSCVAPSIRLRRAHAKRCTRTVAVGTLRRLNLHVGADVVAFSGRIGRRALSPGTYKAVLAASNAAGRSRQILLHFTVVR